MSYVKHGGPAYPHPALADENFNARPGDEGKSFGKGADLMQASPLKNPHDPTLTPGHSADIYTALHGTSPEARDAALQRLCREPDELPEPDAPSAGAGMWVLIAVAFGMALCVWVAM